MYLFGICCINLLEFLYFYTFLLFISFKFLVLTTIWLIIMKNKCDYYIAGLPDQNSDSCNLEYINIYYEIYVLPNVMIFVSYVTVVLCFQKNLSWHCNNKVMYFKWQDFDLNPHVVSNYVTIVFCWTPIRLQVVCAQIALNSLS